MKQWSVVAAGITLCLILTTAPAQAAPPAEPTNPGAPGQARTDSSPVDHTQSLIVTFDKAPADPIAAAKAAIGDAADTVAGVAATSAQSITPTTVEVSLAGPVSDRHPALAQALQEIGRAHV